MNINKDVIEGNWKQLKGHAQATWGELTSDELDEIDGRAEVLAGKIQERYGIDKHEAENQINEFVRKNNFAS